MISMTSKMAFEIKSTNFNQIKITTITILKAVFFHGDCNND